MCALETGTTGAKGDSEMKSLAVALVATFLLSSGPIGAQTKPSINVGVEKLDPDAARCGIVASSLQSIAALTLRNNGIAVSPEMRSMASLFITPTVVQLTNTSCAVYLRLEIVAAMTSREVEGVLKSPPPNPFKPRDPGTIGLPLCAEGNLLLGPAHDTAQRVNATLENQIKLCLGRLVY